MKKIILLNGLMALFFWASAFGQTDDIIEFQNRPLDDSYYNPEPFTKAYSPSKEDSNLEHKIHHIIQRDSCSELLIAAKFIDSKWTKKDISSRIDYFLRFIMNEIERNCINSTKALQLPPPLPMTWKPIIYLYPETTTNINVKLQVAWSLFYTYPKYDNWWSITASPDGKIIDEQGQEYSYLFWDGFDTHDYYDLTKGFVVTKEKLTQFLQKSLSASWLLPHEYNEFIVYWVPKMLMHDSPYYLIHFADEQEYNNRNPLTITPSPDILERIYVVFQPLKEYIKVTPQQLEGFERDWFTVVERWGTDLWEQKNEQ